MVLGYTGTSTCGSMELVASSFSLQHAQHNCLYLKSLSSQWQQQRRPWFGFSCKRTRNLDTSGRSLKMILNGYIRRDTYKMKKDNDEKIYWRLDSSLVIPPPKGKKPKAIIKFLGGAFIGAVPEVTYSYLLGLLANKGYLIISVPYNVTFDHSQGTREVYERFHSCLSSILTSGLPDDDLLAAELCDLPFYSVGHSNGALLQVLTGSYFSDKLPKANAIISYNNLPATEGSTLLRAGPLVNQLMPVVEASPVSSVAKGAADAWKALLDTAEAMTPDYDPETRVSLTKFVDQLPSVFNQEYLNSSQHQVRTVNATNVKKTLLMKFNVDAIDETDLLEEASCGSYRWNTRQYYTMYPGPKTTSR